MCKTYQDDVMMIFDNQSSFNKAFKILNDYYVELSNTENLYMIVRNITKTEIRRKLNLSSGNLTYEFKVRKKYLNFLKFMVF